MRGGYDADCWVDEEESYDFAVAWTGWVEQTEGFDAVLQGVGEGYHAVLTAEHAT